MHLLAKVLRDTGLRSEHKGRRTAPTVPIRGGADHRSGSKENHDLLERLVGDWGPDTVPSFADAVFLQCEVVVVILTNLDEAFQMFDSQNARGRALYPTDLLKAFHLREIGGGLRDAGTKREVVELWEDIPAAHVNALFAEYLFKIRLWSAGDQSRRKDSRPATSACSRAYANAMTETMRTTGRAPFVYAKNYTDDFRLENATLVRFRMLGPVEYPHQIDHPVLNGETFFRMVSHYYRTGCPARAARLQRRQTAEGASSRCWAPGARHGRSRSTSRSTWR